MTLREMVTALIDTPLDFGGIAMAIGIALIALLLALALSGLLLVGCYWLAGRIVERWLDRREGGR